jgi:hypothetical protein
MKNAALSPYQKKLRDPRWQKKRLEILERDEWRCQRCRSTEKTLAVHHRVYFDKEEPWEVADTALETLCEECHQEETDNGKEAEKHLIMTLRGLGVPWFALDVFAYEMQRCFPPLKTDDALTVIAVLKKYLPKISEAMGLEPPDGPLEE